MQDLIPLAEKIAVILKDRHENIAVAESTTGGLISAALLSVPGASTYFVGGAVVYTLKARRAMLDVPDSAFAGIKSVTEEGAMILARAARTAIRSHLDHRRNRRQRPHRQPLRRRRRPQLHRSSRPRRALADRRNRQRRSRRQHAHLRDRRLESVDRKHLVLDPNLPLSKGRSPRAKGARRERCNASRRNNALHSFCDSQKVVLPFSRQA